jgi:hypothetical protein
MWNEEVPITRLIRRLVRKQANLVFPNAPKTADVSSEIVNPTDIGEQQHIRCDFSRFVGSGPREGEVTRNGRSGTISGQWTTNCKPDASQLLGLSALAVTALQVVFARGITRVFARRRYRCPY